MSTVYVLTSKCREDDGRIGDIGVAAYGSLETAIEALVAGIVEDNRLDAEDDPEGEIEPVTVEDVRAFVTVDEDGSGAYAFDPWVACDYLIQKVQVEA